MDESQTMIDHISLVFENCECIDLFPNMFKGLIINEIIKSYWINCFQDKQGESNTFLQCKELRIEINRKGLRSPYEGKTVKDRLLLDTDITHIHVYFKDGTDDYISVPWDETERYNNKNQKTIKHKDSIEIQIIEG